MTINPGRVAIQYLDGTTYHVEIDESLKTAIGMDHEFKGFERPDRLKLLEAAYLSEIRRQAQGAIRDELFNRELAKEA